MHQDLRAKNNTIEPRRQFVGEGRFAYLPVSHEPDPRPQKAASMGNFGFHGGGERAGVGGLQDTSA